MRPLNNTALTILLLLAMTAWGASWTSGKMIADFAAPQLIIFWRFTVTFLTFIPIMLFFKKPFKLNRKAFIQVTLGALFIISYNNCFFTGLTHGFAGAGGVLVTTLNPIFTFIMSLIIFKRKLTIKGASGILLGLLGGLMILQIWEVNLDKLITSGNLFFALASFSWASLSVTSEYSKKDVSPLVFSFYVYGMAALLDLIFVNPSELSMPLHFSFTFWFNLVYLSLFATTFATTIYFAASTHLGSHRSSSFIFLVPFSAVLISWMILGEKPQFTTILGGITAIAAVYLINAVRQEKP